MKELGVRCYRIMMRNTIQPQDRRKSSRGGGTGGTSYKHQQDVGRNRNVAYLIWNGERVIVNWNWLENRWNGTNPVLLANLFISLSIKRRESFSLKILMNPWASRRKGLVFTIFFIVLLFLILVPAYFLTRSTPVCNNGVQDGDETGVDCGGSCKLICKPETLPLIARGEARVLKIAPETYVASILIENPNIDGEVLRAPYTISIYTSGTREPVRVINKDTYIGRSSTFALFEGPFNLKGGGPYRAVFEWGDNLVWEKSSAELPLIAVDNISLTNASTSPRLEARLTNRTTRTLSNIEVIALLSDEESNTIYSGKTFVDGIPSGETLPVSFGWPKAFENQPVSIRILPHVLPDKSYLR